MKLLMEAEQAKLYDLENGYYVTQEHCSWTVSYTHLDVYKRKVNLWK